MVFPPISLYLHNCLPQGQILMSHFKHPKVRLDNEDGTIFCRISSIVQVAPYIYLQLFSIFDIQAVVRTLLRLGNGFRVLTYDCSTMQILL